MYYLAPPILYPNKTLYPWYREEGRKGKKGGKNCSRVNGHRQEFTAREILSDSMKTANYKLEHLATIEFLPSTNKGPRKFVNRNS